MKKIVIISANTFPYVSPRANRSHELAKEFVKRGHDVTLYSLQGNINYSELELKYNIKYKNLGNSKFGIISNDGSSKSNIFIKILKYTFLGKYIDFPNSELIFSVYSILKEEKKIDTLLTIAHPFSINWGVLFFLKFNKKNFKKWISDCGDPFFNNPIIKPKSYFKHLERLWSKETNIITIPIREAKGSYFIEAQNKIKIIPQGFDNSNIILEKYNTNTIPTFSYAGSFYIDHRNPIVFLEYLCSLDINFRFICYTSSKLINRYKTLLKDKLIIKSPIERSKLIVELSKMDFLINISNNSDNQLPSKLIDYALTKRPILEIDSSFKQIEIFQEFMKGDYSNQLMIENIEKYDIKNVVDQFEIIL